MHNLFRVIVSLLLKDIGDRHLRMAELLDETQVALNLSPADGTTESQALLDLAQQHFDDYESEKLKQRRRMARLRKWLQFWNFGIDCRRN